MAGTFRELSDEFSKAARNLRESGKPSEILLMRYHLLFRHKAATDEHRAELVKSLYECGTGLLKPFIGPNSSGWMGGYLQDNVRTIFEVLREPETLRHMPESASGELADIALELLAKSDRATRPEFSSYENFNTYTRSMVAFSQAAMQTADACAAEVASRVIDIKTSKSITPAKRIVLKAPDNGGTP